MEKQSAQGYNWTMEVNYKETNKTYYFKYVMDSYRSCRYSYTRSFSMPLFTLSYLNFHSTFLFFLIIIPKDPVLHTMPCTLT